MLWSKLSGRYVILDSQYQEEMELKISILTQDGMKLMRISRYNHSGALVAEGFAWLTQNQKSVGVRLRPLGKKAHPMYAYIKLYHGTDSLSCEMNSLVPILSLVEKRPEMTTEIQYRLVRRPIQQ